MTMRTEWYDSSSDEDHLLYPSSVYRATCTRNTNRERMIIQPSLSASGVLKSQIQC
jgi:hypothetical protein